MRPVTSPLPVPRRQLAEWRQPLDEDPAVEEAVRSVDRYLQRSQKPDDGHH
jgi:hypothetical protein